MKTKPRNINDKDPRWIAPVELPGVTPEAYQGEDAARKRTANKLLFGNYRKFLRRRTDNR